MACKWLSAVVVVACARPAANERRPFEEPLTRNPSATAPISTASASSERDVPHAPSPSTLGPSTQLASDKGIFGDLDPQLKPTLPAWLRAGPLDVWREREGDSGWVLVAGVPVAPALANQRTTLRGAELRTHDADADGIPDAYDVLLGAKKVEINGAEYRSNYTALAFPGGDVPRNEGVCSDVVVRALRNAGIDLQREIYDDAALSPTRYPNIEKRDKNIDHRRVKNLLPWFVAHWLSLDTQFEGSSEPWLPGDVVFFDTLKAAGPDHLGILADRAGESGLPLVINNWTDGYRESAMDLLARVPVTHRFRVAAARLPVAEEARGLPGLLARHQLTLPPSAEQVVLVVASLWDQNAARLYRFQRPEDARGPEAFVLHGKPFAVRLGSKGLGLGLGLHDSTPFTAPTTKREGDRRSPAGIFSFGVAFGRNGKPPSTAIVWPWRQTQSGDVYVDDASSKFYNTWQRELPGHDWRSREDLTQYELGIVVNHNAAQTPGAGSAIFVHSLTHSRPTTGCTGLSTKDLTELLAWLKPDAHPVLVQVGGALYGPQFEAP